MATGFTPTFSAAGTGHRAGAVPDPGQDTPASYVLRADATWGPGPAGAQQFGIEEFTITAPNASATAQIPFSPAYLVPPPILCASSEPSVMASAHGQTTGGFIAEVTVATPLVIDQAVTFTYMAI